MKKFAPAVAIAAGVALLAGADPGLTLLIGGALVASWTGLVLSSRGAAAPVAAVANHG